MAHIDELISSGDERGAATRYARLWKVVRSMTLGNPTLIQALVAAGLSERLVEFYVEEREPALRPAAAELGKLVSAVEANLGESLARSFIGTYLAFRHTFENASTVFCSEKARAMLDEISCPIWEPGWPFYDKRQTLKTYHDMMVSIVGVSRKPFYLAREELVRIDTRADEIAASFSFLRNPFGSALASDIIPQVARFADTKDGVKSSLSAFRYILQVAESGFLDDVPIDPRTGVPFTVTDKGDTMEIISEYLVDGEPAFSYEFAKPQ